MTTELHLTRRPTSYKDVIGQPGAVKQLVGFGKADAMPHCLLFTGPSGCGKTTLARITRRKLGCGDADFVELNCASTRGIDAVRAIQERMNLSPINGKCRVYLVDECHQLTADAQGAFLKILEEPPEHVYFMLATTHPGKLRKAVITRCTQINVVALSDKQIEKVVRDSGGEGLAGGVMAKLIAMAEGSARKALVYLGQVLAVGDADPAAQLAAMEGSEDETEAIEIARSLLRGVSWSVMAKQLKTVSGEPESLRYLVLSYCTTVALGGGKAANRAVAIIDEFSEPYFYTKKAGLVASCHAVCTAGK